MRAVLLAALTAVAVSGPVSTAIAADLTPARAPSPAATGFYAGVKVGGSGLDLSNRSINYGAFEYTEGDHFSGDDQSWDMGSGTDTVFGGGVLLGYNFNRLTGFPVRLEFDYYARGRGEVNRAYDVVYNISTNGVPTPEAANLGQHDKISLQTALASLYFDIPTGGVLTPFVGGGIGAAFIDHTVIGIENGTDTFSNSRSSTNFAWSLGGGLAWAINERLTVDLSYRYVNAGTSTVAKGNWEPLTATTDIASQDVTIGLRANF
ncbi:outer membrane protein [Blastochloris sulfoviridis]|uniref:Porin family protein n=1 Tax=Blastochloris sulfoviridis TaxID=50712 RepID=A0A5M6I4J9_9HYPH|nr:outer membrane beta-barrel protein [Blastochloris sulfoviridis]KAA5603151.1 porin family protein [Blastochloris sulfoviridis]